MLSMEFVRARLALALLMLCPIFLAAQDTSVDAPPPPSANSQADQANPPQDQSAETLKVNVDVVNVFCNVKDKHGALIPDLKKDDFNLSEDGKPQTVKYFSADTEQPLSLGLLMDTSGSMIEVIPAEKEVAGEFLNQVLRPKDLAFFLTFDVDVELLQDFTSSPRQIRHAMEQAKVNAPPSPNGGLPGLGGGPLPTARNSPGTTLYDAVFLASDEKLATETGRKAVIIMSDGVDEGSKIRLQEAIEAAQKADVICYVLLFTRGIYGSRGDSYMRQLAEQTGGRVIEVSDRYDKMKQGFDQIANELRTQYALGYTPTNSKKDGTFRKIDIKSKEGYKVQARRGYYAIPQR